MAEYIDREKLKTDFDDKAYYISHGRNNVERGMTLYGINQMIDEQQPADVVERSEYIELLKENERLRKDLEDKSEALNSICQIHQEYVSKINTAIEEIEQAIKECKLRWASIGMKYVLGILKKNIGE